MTNLDQLLSQVAREEDALLVAGHRRALVRRRLETVKSQRQTRHWSPWTALALAGCCAAASAAVAFSWVSRQPPRLTATAGVSSIPVSSGAWLDAPETASLPLRFSDGTRVEVAPRARLRLLELGNRGALLALESGGAGVEVAHGENRRWELRAGPFIVRVTGTRFDLSWRPNEDQFELVLNEGQVELAGCGFGDGRKLVAGQTVRASCRDGAVEVSFSSGVAVAGGTNAPPSPVPVPPVPEVTSDARAQTSVAMPKAAAAFTGASSAVPVEVEWKSLAEQGRYKDALVAVDRLGFMAECARARADELVLLGDTARHAREPNKARQAFSLVRQRFFGTSHAGVAAFSLGVLEFDHWGDFAKAADWFRTYVKENPKGPLIREARGRLMEALQRSGSDEARSLATSYLRDYPAGPHAELAQRIVQAR